MTDKMGWVDEAEKLRDEEFEKGYFKVVEGDNRIQLLTHCAQLPQKWTGTKYEIAQEGDTNVSIKGVCWVLQDGIIKQAKLPYTVVKQVRALQQDPDYAFENFPMPRLINIKAKDAGTKEVEYTVIPAPKEVEVPADVLAELATKPTPEDIVEKLKGKLPAKEEVVEEEVKPEDIPF